MVKVKTTSWREYPSLITMAPTQYRVAVVGEVGVGKTTWLHRLNTGEFLTKHEPSPYDHQTTLSMWFRGGATPKHNVEFVCTEYRTVAAIEAVPDAIVVVCDTTSATSYIGGLAAVFQAMDVYKTTPVILCATRCDLKGADYSRHIVGVFQWRISAKSNYNYEKPWLWLARKLAKDDTIEFELSPAVEPPEVMV